MIGNSKNQNTRQVPTYKKSFFDIDNFRYGFWGRRLWKVQVMDR